MQADATPQLPTDRPTLRAALLAARDRFVESAFFADASAALERRLVEVLRQLEPACLGLYWPIRSEFNAVKACTADSDLATIDWALPFSHRSPPVMEFRQWNKQPPALPDEFGINSVDGRPVIPDVILLPCVGFSADGYRLGYGAGFFDRWQASHPHVTAIGVSWSVGLMAPTQFQPQPHDQPLMLVVTEQGVIGG